MQPAYWVPDPQYRSSPLANIAAIVLLVVGCLLTIFGLILLLVGAGGAALLEAIDPTLSGEADFIAAVILMVALVLLVMGVLEIASGIGIFIHRSWARWMGVVLATIGVVFGFLLMIGTFVPPATDAGDAVIAIVWLAAHGFAAAALVAAGEHFQPISPGR